LRHRFAQIEKKIWSDVALYGMSGSMRVRQGAGKRSNERTPILLKSNAKKVESAELPFNVLGRRGRVLLCEAIESPQ
jgi:hypothetical protein